MQSFSLLFLLTVPSVLALPLAQQAAKQAPNGGFTLKLERNENYKRPSGLEAMLHAYAKHGMPLTDDLKNAAERNLALKKRIATPNGAASVSATPPGGSDYEYILPVSVGTPAQQMNLNLDSGSSDLWVMSSLQPSSQINGQSIYNPSKSSTAKQVSGASFKVQYGDGSTASGAVYTDKFAIGGIAFANQTVEVAKSVSAAFTSDSMSSGILGLAMSSGNQVTPNKALTFMDNMKTTLPNGLFTANLKHSIPGTYNFGFINTDEFNGTIQYTPRTTNSVYWQFQVNGHSVGPQPSSAIVADNYNAIADTGTTLLLVPSNVISDYYGKVSGAVYNQTWAAWTFPCSAALPDFAFVIGSYRGILPGRYINYGSLPGNTNFCYGGMQSSSGSSFSIFGDILLKSQFVVFDLANNRVGFANKKLTT